MGESSEKERQLMKVGDMNKYMKMKKQTDIERKQRCWRERKR
jgi:hypothetical protein